MNVDHVLFEEHKVILKARTELFWIAYCRAYEQDRSREFSAVHERPKLTDGWFKDWFY